MKVGEILANKYELIEELSLTSSSKVFIARNKNLSDSDVCVVKVISASKQDQHGIYENEIKVLKNITHENMVKLLDTGRCPESNVFYMTMQYIDGVHFDVWLRNLEEETKLPCGIKVALTLLDVLETVHQKDFVHKDIKPSNILVEADNRPYLLDFGISRATETLTTQSQQYSPVYVSPEEIKREEITPATDIYKLGITLIESLLVEDDAQQFREQDLTLNDAIAMVSKGDEKIQGILEKMTASDVSERYVNVRDLRKDLKAWFGHAEEYALVWTHSSKAKAEKGFDCPSFELNEKVISSFRGTAFAEWKDDSERGASIILTTDDFFMRLKPDSSAKYFTIVDYRHSGDDRLKQYGALLDSCQFTVFSSNRKVHQSFNETDDLIGKLQSIELEKLNEKDKQKERKSFLEQANDYQEAQREVFEKKRFKPLMVKVKINRGKHELVCTAQNDLHINESYFQSDEAAANISKQLTHWGIDCSGSSVEKLLNKFIDNKEIYETWLKKLSPVLEKRNFPDLKKEKLSIQADDDTRKEKAHRILLYLFKDDLSVPQAQIYLPDQDCEIGFYESDPSRCKKNQQPFPLLYGVLNKKDTSRRAITLKYGDKQRDNVINTRDLGWIGHFSIREESQLKKQEDALKTLEENKGIQGKLLETLAKVEHLPPRKEEALTLDTYISEELDDNQKKAVAKCVLLENGQFAVLQGPPGTGKTTVITEIVQQILRYSPKAKILVASQSHQAVDNVLGKICNEARVVRLGDEKRLQGRVQEYSYEHIATTMLDEIKATVKQEACYLDEQALDNISPPELDELEALRAEWVKKLSGRDEHLETILFKSVQAVFGTLVGMAANKYKEVNQVFDYVIVDEAGKAILSELAISMNRGQRIILVGDHKQLPPILNEESLSLLDSNIQKSLKTTFFENLYERLSQVRPEYCHILTNNYRMHPAICQPVSHLFYDDMLTTPEVVQREHGLGLKHVWYWLNTSKLSKHYENSSGQGRYYNPYHIDYIEQLLRDLEQRCEKNNQKKTVAIIAPYRESVEQLKRKIKIADKQWKHLNIEIATVDSFQGSDKDIVILDSVRSNQKKNIGFIADAARLNVALSRAKELQFVIGDADSLHDGKIPEGASNPYQLLIEHVRSDNDTFSWVDLKDGWGIADVQ